MVFDHEKLDVYRLALDFVGWAFSLCSDLSGPHRHARDQLIRASQSIPLNIAEGNGKRSRADRQRFWGIARGSAFECAAVLDVLLECKAVPPQLTEPGKETLHRIVSMLTKMTRSPGRVREDPTGYGEIGCDIENGHEEEQECEDGP